jgi:beta-glucanase (GH16 family)
MTMKIFSIENSKCDNLKFAAATACAALTMFAAATTAAQAAPPGMALQWSDEFTGVNNQPNSAVWGYDTGAGGWGNNEWETYVNSWANAHVISDGTGTDNQALQIEAQTDSSGRWYSARINSAGRHTVGPYGYVEYRCKFPNAGAGYWPAAWMLGNNIGSVGWPACGEVDIAEEVDGQWENHQSLHMPGWDPTVVWTVNQSTTTYHNYGANWQPGSITFYMDGQVSATFSRGGGGTWAFDNNPMFLIINLAIGGNFPGSPNSSTQANGNFDVDYVRVYQNTGGGGTISNGAHTMAPACATGSRLDDTNGSTTNGNHLQIWQAGGNSNQSWSFANVGGSDYNMSVNGPYCLDSGGATSNGGAATIWSCNGNTNQRWTATATGGGYTFKAANSGLCLDVAGAGSANGTAVDTWQCNGTNAQTWFIQ